MVFTPYCFYMYNRGGECVQYIEWSRPRGRKNEADDAKMMFGLLFSLNSFVAKVDPTAPPGAPPQQGGPPPVRRVGFRAFRTNTYKLHYFEVPSGIQLALCTDPGAPDLRDALRHIYSSLYVELVQKSPLHAPGRPFVSEPFVAAVQRYLRAQAA
jgi:hypothetical protein